MPGIQRFLDKLVARDKSMTRCSAILVQLAGCIFMQPIKIYRALKYIWNDKDQNMKRKHDELKVNLSKVFLEYMYTL